MWSINLSDQRTLGHSDTAPERERSESEKSWVMTGPNNDHSITGGPSPSPLGPSVRGGQKQRSHSSVREREIWDCYRSSEKNVLSAVTVPNRVCWRICSNEGGNPGSRMFKRNPRGEKWRDGLGCVHWERRSPRWEKQRVREQGTRLSCPGSSPAGKRYFWVHCSLRLIELQILHMDKKISPEPANGKDLSWINCKIPGAVILFCC